MIKASNVMKYKRHIAVFFLLNFCIEVFSPTVALALTSGPSQPEVQEFQAINVSDMVDPASGDFSYNLPLLEVDGYPVNLSYRAGVNMDQEATAVGLGWNMNVGSISRSLRGIPDDFNGEEITKKFNMKDNISYGVSLGVGGELFGIDDITANLSYGLTYNSYTGYDFVQKMGFSFSLGDNMSIGLGLASSSDGLTISPNLNFQAQAKDKEGNALKGSASLGTSYNSRTGIKEVGLNVSASASFGNQEKKSTKGWSRDKVSEGKNKHSSSNNLGSVGNGSSIGFGSPTYIPQITMPMHTSAIMGSFKLGGTIFGVDVSADIAGNYSRQALIHKSLSLPAYGYLHLQNGQNGDKAMLDFNREKDGNLTEGTTNLPIPNLTYDNFSVMGQGVGGSYRAFRSDVGYVYDPRATNTSESNSIGAEVKLGNVVQGGIDFINTSVQGSSGKWSHENAAIKNIGFKGAGVTGYEPAYFKEMGEMNVDDDPLYTNIKEESAVRFELDDLGSTTGLQNNMITENSVVFNITNQHKRTKRIKKNQLFSYLTVEDYQIFALQPNLFPQIARYNGGNLINGHQIAEIITTKTDGSRYVYGLPVFNSYQKEASFNVSGFSSGQYIASSNLVQYGGSDDTESNSKGTDNFFTSTETPAYAYAYMLTAVLSSDYVDKTGDGPSPDDLGTYTLFNYDLSQKISDYKWRTPSVPSGNYATLDAGLLSNKNDNKASYVYGEKDIYYLTSIQGKNNIALLEYSNRPDGKGVSGSGGAMNSSISQKQLDKMTLYSMNDHLLKQANPAYNPFVIKQVHFGYSNELCPGIYNFSGTSNGGGNGKLTLKEVYFTFGNSNKGKLSPYRFNYNNQVNASTVNYDPASTDRWGNYKPNNTSCPNSVFPYVEQNKVLEDQYVALWNLKSIQLPSGGLMEVNYESDEYAYIQNRRAGEMFKVIGAGPNLSTINQQLFSGSGAHRFLYFLPKPSMALNPSSFENDYLEGIDQLYFRFFVNVNCGSNAETVSAVRFSQAAGHEFVHGYAEVDRSAGAACGTTVIGGTTYGWVKVKTVRQSKANNTQEHPISKTAWQLARVQTPRDAYQCMGGNDPASGASDVEGVLKAMASASFIKNTIQTFKGYNGTLKSAGYGQNFISNLSWIRLNNPDYRKLGGGLRVRRVTIADKWDKMLSSNTINATQAFQYGQEYDYNLSENGKYMTSGVASYEPTFGADENSFRKPVFMDAHKEEALLSPDNNMYVEEPMGESFFPSPNVVYRSVGVKSIAGGSGMTVNEYYTAKDFPTYVHELGMIPKRNKPNPILKLFSFSTYDRFTGTQGYSIELNDMHGKAKAVHQYEEGASAPFKSTIYKYRQSGDKLVNTVRTVAKNGAITDSRIGVDYDFYADFRENNTSTEAIGVQGNLYFMMAGFFPIVVGPILPSFHSEEIQLRTAVTNKVIYKYGILERVENFENSNLIATDNLLWDSETGQVLLTATTTEWKDPLYSTAYPGHWAYEGLSGGYKNVGLEIPSPSGVVNSSGQITSPQYAQLLFPGDEIALITAGGGDKGYVDKIGNSLYFTKNVVISSVESSLPLDQSALSGYTKIKVLRSGRHNLQDQKVGVVTTFKNPLHNNPSTWPVLDKTYQVTNASAIQLGSTWQSYCGCNFIAGGTSATTAYPNQYVHGIKGNYRKVKDYSYLSLRKQTKVEGNSNIRVDGTFENYSPFWAPNGGNDWVSNTNNWTWVTEATKFSPYGFDFENKDALERRSSAQYGYNQSLPVAIASNSKFKHMANESFEYNNLNICQDNHFGFNQHEASTYGGAALPVKVQKYSHTGKRSIAVPPSGTVTVTKQINQCEN